MKKRSRNSSPIANWPLWKAVAVAGLVYGGTGAILTFSASYAPVFVPWVIGPVSASAAILGVAFIVWSRTNHWLARAGTGATYCALLFLFAWRSWFAVLSGVWLWIVILALAAVLALAWALPGLSSSLSERLWLEQTAPRTGIGRTAVRWTLGLGLGVAGVAAASLGMSLVRAGKVHLAYLIMALGMSLVAMLMAQGYSHQLWADRPWASRPDRTEERGIS